MVDTKIERTDKHLTIYHPDKELHENNTPCEKCRGKHQVRIWSGEFEDLPNREDGPAFRNHTCEGNGTHTYYISWNKQGRPHRVGGPATVVTTVNGEVVHRKVEWNIDGKKHREDGPAVMIYHGGTIEERWFLNDERFDIQEFADFIALPKATQIELKLVYG